MLDMPCLTGPGMTVNESELLLLDSLTVTLNAMTWSIRGWENK